MSEYTKPVCRGSWALGTACGKCERCLEARPQPSAEPVAVWRVAQAIDDLEWLSTDGRFNPQLTAVIASALEAARREALEGAVIALEKAAAEAEKAGMGGRATGQRLCSVLRSLEDNTNAV